VARSGIAVRHWSLTDHQGQARYLAPGIGEAGQHRSEHGDEFLCCRCELSAGGADCAAAHVANAGSIRHDDHSRRVSVGDQHHDPANQRAIFTDDAVVPGSV
jgi:hypothetical protein